MLSNTRSGSTLLDQLPGVHQGIVLVGQLHWLRAHLRQNQTLNVPVRALIWSCVDTVIDCPFWREVSAALGKPLYSLRFRLSFIGHSGSGNDALGLSGPPRQPPRHSMALFDSIFAVMGNRCVVDFSRLPFRSCATRGLRPWHIRSLSGTGHRAGLCSKMKCGQSLKGGAIPWGSTNAEIDALTADLPTKRTFRLKYETLYAES